MGGLLWLASYPKSGNTWVRAFLHNYMEPGDGPHDINRLNRLTVGDAEARLFEAASGKAMSALSLDEVLALRCEVQRRLAAEVEGMRIVKTHSAMMRLRGHTTIDVGVSAGAIYVVRNPLDVAVSFRHHLGEDQDRVIEFMNEAGAHTENTPEVAAEVLGSWSQNVLGWTGRPNPGLHVMRYEDMLADPVATFRALAAFLRLPADEARLGQAADRSSFGSLRDQEAAGGFVERGPRAERFFREGRSGGWREALTSAQARRVVDAHRAQMARFGYVPEGM